MVLNKQKSLKIIKIFSKYFLIFLISLLFLMKIFNAESYSILIDYKAYREGISELKNNKLYQSGSFIYLPSFFFLSIFLININIFIVFLVVCLCLSLFLLIKLKESIIVICLVLFSDIERIICANIDPFLFLVIASCLHLESVENKKYNIYLIPILLAFITFKPTIIFIVPYFLFKSENKLKFLFIYCFSVISFNFYFIFHFGLIFKFLNYGFLIYQDIRTYLRSFWIYYIYYYGLKEYCKQYKNIIYFNKKYF